MKRSSSMKAAFAAALWIAGAGTALAAEAQSFSDVAPILNKNCITCHSGAKPPHGLRLDSYENVMKGAKDGPVVVPGSPGKSEMFRRVTGQSKPIMPMQGAKLSDDAIRQVELWIAAGAPR